MPRMVSSHPLHANPLPVCSPPSISSFICWAFRERPTPQGIHSIAIDSHAHKPRMPELTSALVRQVLVQAQRARKFHSRDSIAELDLVSRNICLGDFLLECRADSLSQPG